MNKNLSIFLLAIFTLFLDTHYNNLKLSTKKMKLQSFESSNIDSTELEFKEQELGCGVNVVIDDYYCPKKIITESSVYNNSFLNEAVKYGKTLKPRHWDCSVSSGSRYYSYLKDYDENISSEIGLGVPLDKLFNASSKEVFTVDFRNTYQETLSNYFFEVDCWYESYNRALSNITDDDSYCDENNMTREYLNAIDKLFDKSTRYYCENLFKEFGTHIICKGSYGGLYKSHMMISSNTSDLSEKNGASLELEARAFFEYKGVPVSVNSNNKNIAISMNTMKTSECIYNTKIESFGGNSATSFCLLNETNKDTIFNKIENWGNSIDNNESLIFVSKYKPIWEALPSKYNTESNKKWIIDEFKKYVSRYTSNYFTNASLEKSSPSILDYNNISLLESKVLVQGDNDSTKPSSLNLKRFSIDLNDKYYYSVDNSSSGISGCIKSLSDLKKIGYKNCLVTIKIKYSDYKNFFGFSDEGIKYVILSSKKVTSLTFNGSNPKTDNSTGVLGYKKFSNSTKEKISSVSINISDLELLNKNEIHVSFGAYGNESNKWYIYDFDLSLKFGK